MTTITTIYSTVAEAQDYLTSIGIDTFVGDEVALLKLLLRASYDLDNKYGKYYPGMIVLPTQPLLWPRTACLDAGGRYVLQGDIPVAIKRACALMANTYLAGGTLTPQIQPTVEKVEIAGAILEETHYAAPSGAATLKSQALIDIESELSALVGNKFASATVKVMRK